MYEEKLLMTMKQSPTQSEHLDIAQQFSNEMMDRFNPEQVNEILHHIRKKFKERREMEIAEAQNKLAYLQNTIESL
jgi:thermostable 8-oxoguanine DNA glycosylase